MMSGEPILVLHVDDEPDIAHILGKFLEEEDPRLEVRSTTDVEEGIELVGKNDFDCIISDYEMPKTSGLDFLETVRVSYPDLPFILFTGKGSEEIASDAISAGVTDYLQKAGSIDQFSILAHRVINAVEAHRVQQQAQRRGAQFEAISENSTDAIMIIGPASKIRFANPAVADIFGYSPEELEGGSLLTIMPVRHRDAHLEAIESYLKTGKRSVSWSNVEFYGLHRNGEEIPLSVSYSEYEHGGEKRFLGVVRDLSDGTQLEQTVASWAD